MACELTFVSVLDKLKFIPSAVFEAQSTEGCMENTRVSVLTKLFLWAQDNRATPILWLTGMAGTGKTSIASSFCYRLDQEADLGGSFFCFRTGEQTEVRVLIQTLVRLLARTFAAFEAAIIAELTYEPDITDMTVMIQVDRLLRKTLAKLPTRYQLPLVLVIDALDECSSSLANSGIYSCHNRPDTEFSARTASGQFFVTL